MPNTREKLIELLSQAQYLGGLEEKVADHLIANGVTVQKWIPVTERLPDVGRDVLFVCENKSYGVGAYSDTYRDFFSGQFPVKGVTHWMHLPEPPKGERQ